MYFRSGFWKAKYWAARFFGGGSVVPLVPSVTLDARPRALVLTAEARPLVLDARARPLVVEATKP